MIVYKITIRVKEKKLYRPDYVKIGSQIEVIQNKKGLTMLRPF